MAAPRLRIDPVAALRRSLPRGESARQLAEIFRVLGDETRVRLLAALSGREARVSDLARALRMTDSAVSHQLALLRALRVVRRRRDGRSIWYSLDDHHVADLFDIGLQHIAHR